MISSCLYHQLISFAPPPHLWMPRDKRSEREQKVKWWLPSKSATFWGYVYNDVMPIKGGGACMIMHQSSFLWYGLPFHLPLVNATARQEVLYCLKNVISWIQHHWLGVHKIESLLKGKQYKRCGWSLSFLPCFPSIYVHYTYIWDHPKKREWVKSF